MRIFLRSFLVATAVIAKAAVLLAAASFAQLSMAQQDFSCVGMPFLDVGERRLRALDPAVARRLESPRYLLNPYPPEDDPDAILPEPDPVAAIRELDDVRTDRLQSHERADVFDLYAWAHYLNDNVPGALDYYKRIIAEEGANGSTVERTLQTIAKLNMLNDDFQEALNYYINWACVRIQKPDVFLASDDYAYLALIYYRIDDLNQALYYIGKAITMEETAGNIGRENWYVQQYSFYYQNNEVPSAIEVLKKLIVYYPNVKYWRGLAGFFSEMENTEAQLAAYHLAYLQGGLETESQMKSLSYLMMAAGAPYQGANLMIEGIDSGLIEEDEDILQTIGSAFYQAREMDLALPWMERAAEAGGEGQSYAVLAGIFSALLRYEDTIRAGEEALRLGDLNRPDQIKLTIGAAHAALRDYDSAIATLRTITDSRSTRIASNFIGYATSEKEREAQIRASGIDPDNLPDLL